jgi:hypothetical protein
VSSPQAAVARRLPTRTAVAVFRQDLRMKFSARRPTDQSVGFPEA